MKKIKIYVTIIAILSLTLILTSCKKETYQKVTLETDTQISTINEMLEAKEGTKLLGLFSLESKTTDQLPAGNYHTLYQKGLVPKGEYYLIYVDDNSDTYPDIKLKDYNFSGWFDNNGRITSISDSDYIYARYISFGEAGLVVLVCVGIVFMMLAVLAIVVSLFRYVAPKNKGLAKQKKVFSMEDIKDEDMLVAALIATIDYHNEIKKDVRVVSIKEIK